MRLYQSISIYNLIMSSNSPKDSPKEVTCPPVIGGISSSIWNQESVAWLSSADGSDADEDEDEEEAEEEEEEEEEEESKGETHEDEANVVHYPPVRRNPSLMRTDTVGLEEGLPSANAASMKREADDSPGSPPPFKRQNCIFCLSMLKKGTPMHHLNIMNLNCRTIPSWTCIQWYEMQEVDNFTMLEKRMGAFIRNGVNKSPLIFEFEAEMLHMNLKNRVEVRLPLASAFDTINKIDESVFLQYPGQKDFHSNVVFTNEGVTVYMNPMWNDPVLGYYGPKPYYTGQTRVWAWPVLYPLEGSEMFVQWIMCTNLSALTDSYCVPCAKKLLKYHNYIQGLGFLK